jgi:vancomycin resistance protein VanJ
MKPWLRKAAAVAGVSYVVALVIVVVLFRFVGERWWATGVGLYLPRVAFFGPLPFTTAALVVFGPRKLLYTQLLAALIVLFPMMGFVVNLPTKRAEASLRVLTFNVNSVFSGADAVTAAIMKYSPDVVVAQEVFQNDDAFQASLQKHFPTVQGSTQFMIATKYPIVGKLEPEKLPYGGRARSPRFMRYVLDTPLGRTTVYSVHPISPRFGFYSIRGAGLRKEILSGRFFRGERTDDMQYDSGLRATQVRAFTAMAAAETGPVIVAGDTNLPKLSPLLSQDLSVFVDGFASAGFGFGYTFPAKHPWMRIDRIMTSHDLEFSSFQVGCEGASDHLCAVADVQRR